MLHPYRNLFFKNGDVASFAIVLISGWNDANFGGDDAQNKAHTHTIIWHIRTVPESLAVSLATCFGYDDYFESIGLHIDFSLHKTDKN